MAKKKKKRSGSLKARLSRPKPWVKLGISRARYERDRMWKSVPGVTRAEFEDMLEKMPQEGVDALWEQAETEVHEENEAEKIDGLLRLIGFEAGEPEEDR